MLDEEFLLSLPADPEAAFPAYVDHVKSRILGSIPDDEQDQSVQRRTEYLTHIFAYADCYELSLDISRQVPSDSNFWGYYSDTCQRIDYYAAYCRLRAIKAQQSGVVSIYILTPSQKLEMHHHVDQLRQLIAKANITDNKRDLLSKKLEAFAVQIDLSRTKLEGLFSFYMFAKKEAKSGVDTLLPVLEKVDSILDKVSKFTEYLGLNGPSSSGKLPAPPKRIENKSSSLDDEVPF